MLKPTKPDAIHPAHLGAVVVLLLAMGASAEAIASRFGRNGFSGNPETNGGAVCTACHGPGAVVPTLDIVGPELVNAGSTHVYTLTLSGGPGATGGVNVSVSEAAGELGALDESLHPIGDELAHRTPRPFAGGGLQYRFQWTAPGYNGRFGLFAAANSSNGALDLAGDGIAVARLVVTVQNGAAPPQREVPPSSPIALRRFAAGFERPVAIASAGDDRLFVAEQAGRIRVLSAAGQVLAAPFLDIAERVDDSGNEQGLLGLAFHPNYADNGHFFVYYTRDPGSGPDRSRISRFQVSGNADRALPASEQVLLEFEQPFSNHNGGDLKFGPDGKLYVASGDGGGAGDPGNNAQNGGVLLGKLLRIDVDNNPQSGGGPDCSMLSGPRYAIPSGNAYGDGKGGMGCDEIYASGLRNPWRLSFDRQSGDLWIADVGQHAREEINFVTAQAGGGLNFGWRCREGDRIFDDGACQGLYVRPVHVLNHDAGACSITGGFVYRGFRYPNLYGQYLFTDFCDTAIRSLSRERGTFRAMELAGAGSIATPATFGEDAGGELYLASLSTGTVYAVAVQSEGDVVGEAWPLRVRQPRSTSWHPVLLRNRFRNPVVVAGPPSQAGGDPVTVRVRRITAAGFEVQLDEWAYLEGRHRAERLGYLAVEAGNHTLAGGTRLEAGTASVGHRWRRVSFSARFPNSPVVLVQAASSRGPAPVTERLRDVTAEGFWVKLQEEQASGGRHRAEKLDWIAMQTGPAARHEAAITAEVVTHTGHPIAFRRGFTQTPVLLASIHSYRGADPAALRYTALDSDGTRIRIQEERSADREVRHSGESIGYAAILPGNLRARRPSGAQSR